MSRNPDSPVQIQMAVAALNSPCNGEYHGNPILEKKSTGRRHVFVPTETGCILGMETDRGGNAHTVKRRLQLSLTAPAVESSSTLGNLIVDNDLSAIQEVSPLLLRRDLICKSSATSCPSPTGKNLQQKIQSCPIEILRHSDCCSARTNTLVKDIVNAIKNGIDPLPVHSGLGGSYYFRNSEGDSIAIVKPIDEEPFAPNNPKGFVGKSLGQPGLKHSVRVGEAGFREVAAYLLDSCNFANVPPTILVKITHSIFNVNDTVHGTKLEHKTKVSKIASLQQYIPHNCDASDYGTSNFPVAAVHRIGTLDVRVFNTDRHAGNLLVRKLDGVGRFGKVDLIPIDHGLCLPECLEDPYFEWIHWPQASIPFSEDELEYIYNLDPARDCNMLRTELPMIGDACLRVLVLCTILLKEAAAFGLCLAEIGEMMSREFKGQEVEPSELELVCIKARRVISEREILFSDSEGGDNEFQFDIDYDDVKLDLIIPKLATDFPCTGPNSVRFRSVNRRKPLSKVAECIEEDAIEVDVEAAVRRNGIGSGLDWPQFPTVPKMSTLLKKVGLDEKSHRHHCGERAEQVCGVANRRCANEKLPSTTSFVNVADMSEEEWALFLEKFKELLYPAFAKRRSSTMGQRQRLGASCQF